MAITDTPAIGRPRLQSTATSDADPRSGRSDDGFVLSLRNGNYLSRVRSAAGCYRVVTDRLDAECKGRLPPACGYRIGERKIVRRMVSSAFHPSPPATGNENPYRWPFENGP